MGTNSKPWWVMLCLWTVACIAADANPRLCVWTQPRGAVVRDTLYMDGGQRQYCQWDATASAWLDMTAVSGPEEERGYLYTLNFSKSFDVSTNFSDIFTILPTAGGFSNNPPFIDGYMFADDYEFYTYGGLSLTEAGEKADLINNRLYQPEAGSTKQNPYENWTPDFDTHYTPTPPISKNVTHGAGVSIPSEHLGFYFSGMQTESGGFLIAYTGLDPVSHTLDNMLKIDMKTISDATWTNTSLPDHVRGRGSASLVWLPVSDQGLLLAIGGVKNPVDVFVDYSSNASSQTNANNGGPGFMQNISMYDIKDDVWYNQETSGDVPPQLADFCAVMAHQDDPTSYQIFIQGGYNGVDLNKDLNTDVYILSVPSFHWTKVTPLNQDGARWGHVCVTPYPDQMFAVGGQGSYQDIMFSGGKSVEILNLNTLIWQDSYNPEKWSKYKIPAQVTLAGDPSVAAAGMDASLASLFTKKYQQEIVTWYPYVPTSKARKSILGPVLGGVLGGAALVLAAFSFWLWRRREIKKKNRESKMSTATSETLQGSGDHLHGWFRDQAKQSVSATAMEMDTSDQATVLSNRHQSQGEIAELGGRSIFMPRSSMQTNTSLPPESLPEVSGESRKIGELPDSSTDSGEQDSTIRYNEPNYGPRGYANYPRVNKGGLSAAGSTTGQSTSEKMSSLGAGESSLPERHSFQGFPFSESRKDNYEHVYLGGAALPTSEPITTPKQRRIDAYFAASDRTNFDPLPSPNKAKTDEGSFFGQPRPPNAPRQESNASSDFVITPLAMPDDAQQAANEMGMTSAALATSPLSPIRPRHRRNGSSMSSGGQIIAGNSASLPYQAPEEDHRQSAFIENLPENPSRAPSMKRKNTTSRTPPPPVEEEDANKQAEP
ncbi:hypothetical protein LTR84_008938 [Exophiala bonariae]|uniref:Galactose oxidase/kelch, beta-propeller n=1 Tax=Exophiala bonariae TaxID=1690606 RepID=A0AAV9MW21_9EURO|nr:hypothetical protein LTR84_008938 [Exophiala bonariae]